MPAIMQHLDRQQKRAAATSMSERGELPAFYGGFRFPKQIIPVASLRAHHSDTDLEVYGRPDLVLEAQDGSRMVLDHKTASPKPQDHPLFLNYRTQVNLYGWLIENMAEGYSVSKVGLVYFEYENPKDDDVDDLTDDGGITVRFKGIVQQVEYDPSSIVLPLLRKYRELLDMEEPPEGNPDCSDCALLDQWREWEQQKDAHVEAPWMDHKQRQQCAAAARYRQIVGESTCHRWRDNILVRLAQPNGVLRLWLEDEFAENSVDCEDSSDDL